MSNEEFISHLLAAAEEERKRARTFQTKAQQAFRLGQVDPKGPHEIQNYAEALEQAAAALERLAIYMSKPETARLPEVASPADQAIDRISRMATVLEAFGTQLSAARKEPFFSGSKETQELLRIERQAVEMTHAIKGVLLRIPRRS